MGLETVIYIQINLDLSFYEFVNNSPCTHTHTHTHCSLILDHQYDSNNVDSEICMHAHIITVLTEKTKVNRFAGVVFIMDSVVFW